ncbi:hypothetical protein [Paenibacillus sp. URB8-2]|uniref:hypothetical protein n=1 Tax=Paenibacillus sp. URB8-2 TaxID=2741301 RepID=UPI0015BB14B0|nr:hypothetical protein [Paenibacillus sp. URB8-2]BCG57499.1 hypothetical protein PUR_09240 [Paenibacillus sp. URB8-2]
MDTHEIIFDVTPDRTYLDILVKATLVTKGAVLPAKAKVITPERVFDLTIV